MFSRRANVICGLALLAGLVTAFTLGFGYWAVAGDRARSIDDGYREAALVAGSLSGHLAATLRDVTNLAYSVATYVEGEGGFEGVTPLAVGRALTREVLDNSAVAGLIAADSSGRIVASTGRSAPAESWVVMSEAFAFHRDHEQDRAAHVGALVQGDWMAGEWTLPISRGVVDQHGRFNGIVLVYLDLRYIRSFYRSLNTRPRTVLSLLNDEGITLTRIPYKPEYVGVNLSRTMTTQPGSSEGTFELNVSPKDGRTRLVAYQRVPGFPLVVYVGVDKGTILAGWNLDSRLLAGCTLAALLLFYAVCGCLFGWARRTQAAQERFELAAGGLREGLFDYTVKPRRFYRSAEFGFLAGGRGPLWGHTLPDFLGALTEGERFRVLRTLLRSVQDRPGFQFDVTVLRSMAGTAVFFVSGQVVKDAAGEIQRVCGVVCDITALRNAEMQAKRFARRYSVLFEQANEGIALLKDTRFVETNPKLLRMLGLTDASELIGRHPWEFAPRLQPDGSNSRDGAFEQVQAALTGLPVCFTWRLRRVDGSELSASVSLSLVALEGSVLLLAHVRDLRYLGVGPAEERLLIEQPG